MTEAARHQVVVNDEEQYSLWPFDRPLPDGWRAEGFAGGRQECLDHIDEVWTDMRPRSVRTRQDAEDAGNAGNAGDAVDAGVGGAGGAL
jgi:MbtH protein